LERFGIGAAHLVPKYGLDAPVPRTFERELFRMTFAGSDSRFGHGRAARKNGDQEISTTAVDARRRDGNVQPAQLMVTAFKQQVSALPFNVALKPSPVDFGQTAVGNIAPKPHVLLTSPISHSPGPKQMSPKVAVKFVQTVCLH